MDFNIIIYSVLLCLFYFATVICWKYLFIKIKSYGSDYVYHELLFGLLSKNNNKFIYKHDNLINNNIVGYPQLIYRVINYFPRQFRIWLIENFSILMNLFVAIIVSLAVLMYKIFFFEITFIDFSLIILCFFLTPFSYNFSNAKNVGFSIRGYGLFMGILFTGLISLLSITNTGSLSYFILYGCLMVIVSLIFLSNQFAFQYIFFSTPFYYFINFQIEILLLMPVSLLMSFFIFPKYVVNYLKGQLFHKMLYVKFIAKKSILLYRKSVWRDLVYDIPLRLIDRFKKRKNLRGFISSCISDKYTFSNPFIVFLFEFPTVAVSVGFIVFNYKVYCNFEEIQFKLLIAPFLISFILFVLTSFRLTRFLGEPERYLEFTVIQSIVFLVLNINKLVVFTIIFYSAVYIFLRILEMLKPLNNSEKYYEEVVKPIMKIKQEILSTGSDYRIFCNNTDASKCLLHTDIKQFHYWPTILNVDGFTFEELYENSSNAFSTNKLVEVINYYKFNYLIIDPLITSKDFLLHYLPQFKENKELGRFIIYKTVE